MDHFDDRLIRVLGMGNVLMGDDAFGPYVVRTLLARYDLPGEVEAADVGTPGLDLTPYLAEARAVLIVDTVASDGAAGSLKVYDRQALLSAPPPARTSPHQPGLREALMAAELTETVPEEVILIGAVPESTETGTGMSAPLRNAVDRAVGVVVENLQRLGVTPVPRRPAAAPEIWWE